MKYGAELRNKTLASLKREISKVMTSLQDELSVIEDTRSMRVGTNKIIFTSRPNRYMSCILCKTVGRLHRTHYLKDCLFLPEADMGAMGFSSMVTHSDDESIHPECVDHNEHLGDLVDEPALSTNRVNIVHSSILDTDFEDQ